MWSWLSHCIGEPFVIIIILKTVGHGFFSRSCIFRGVVRGLLRSGFGGMVESHACD